MTAVSAAVDAVCRGDERGLADYLKLLAAEQSPGWTQAVSREIAGFLRVSVTAAWRHGWQPAELVRHVGRELGGAHAAMAADMVAFASPHAGGSSAQGLAWTRWLRAVSCRLTCRSYSGAVAGPGQGGPAAWR